MVQSILQYTLYHIVYNSSCLGNWYHYNFYRFKKLVASKLRTGLLFFDDINKLISKECIYIAEKDNELVGFGII